MGSFASKRRLLFMGTLASRALKPEDWQVFLREGVLVAPSVAFSEKRGSIRLNCSRISPEEIPLFCERMVRITRQLSENRQTKIEQ
ncbi:Transcriptional regulator, GntR family [Enterococcus faecalis CBRD01]|nr:Transcriptional regulator, GntR family [Enterococcus faecalis CBRD01]